MNKAYFALFECLRDKELEEGLNALSDSVFLENFFKEYPELSECEKTAIVEKLSSCYKNVLSKTKREIIQENRKKVTEFLRQCGRDY